MTGWVLLGVCGVLCCGTAEENVTTLKDIHLRDPFILPVPEDSTYYLFGTTAHLPPKPGFDVFTSKDLKTWSTPSRAFRPDPGFWADRQFWAPEVHKYKGRYYMFASFKAEGRCRGTQILVSDTPGGPYQVHSKKPVTPHDWECLDGTLFIDEAGQPWIVFCHEWVQVQDGTICARRLSPELDAATGEPLTLFKASDAKWIRDFLPDEKGFVTDGPFLHRTASGKLFLLWSSFSESGYVQAAACSESGHIEGPWRQSEQPVFSDDGGHGMLFRTFEGDLMLVLHCPNRKSEERPCLFRVQEDDAGLTVEPWN